MKRASNFVAVLRTLRAFIGVVAMIPYTCVAAGKAGEHSVGMHPCHHPHSSPSGPSEPAGRGTCKDRSKLTGEQLFRLPFPGAGNQRSCATCHVPEDNFDDLVAFLKRL